MTKLFSPLRGQSQCKYTIVDPVVIVSSPNRPNIFFSIRPYLQLDEFSQLISNELCAQSSNTPKSVVFCQSFVSCYQLYSTLKRKMKEIYLSIWLPRLAAIQTSGNVSWRMHDSCPRKYSE